MSDATTDKNQAASNNVGANESAEYADEKSA